MAPENNPQIAEHRELQEKLFRNSVIFIIVSAIQDILLFTVGVLASQLAIFFVLAMWGMLSLAIAIVIVAMQSRCDKMRKDNNLTVEDKNRGKRALVYCVPIILVLTHILVYLGCYYA